MHFTAPRWIIVTECFTAFDGKFYCSDRTGPRWDSFAAKGRFPFKILDAGHAPRRPARRANCKINPTIRHINRVTPLHKFRPYIHTYNLHICVSDWPSIEFQNALHILYKHTCMRLTVLFERKWRRQSITVAPTRRPSIKRVTRATPVMKCADIVYLAIFLQWENHDDDHHYHDARRINHTTVNFYCRK